mmetsp:Transcript_1907/g.3415  ORF Transcript_1907/g.3415 Transcript_1907/m.3415 type:complete len:163 (-) Transcript_1907:91-579(-)
MEYPSAEQAQAAGAADAGIDAGAAGAANAEPASMTGVATPAGAGGQTSAVIPSAQVQAPAAAPSKPAPLPRNSRPMPGPHSGPDGRDVTNFYPYVSYMPAYRSTYLIAPWQHWSFGPQPRPFYPQTGQLFPYNNIRPFPYPQGSIYPPSSPGYPYVPPPPRV